MNHKTNKQSNVIQHRAQKLTEETSKKSQLAQTGEQATKKPIERAKKNANEQTNEYEINSTKLKLLIR